MALQEFQHISVLLAVFVAATVVATPLDDYVNLPDNHYHYTVMKEQRQPGEYIVYTLNMTSQMWLTYNDSDVAIWWHMLYITIPDTLTHPDHAFVWITGDDNNQDQDDPLTDVELMRTSNVAVGAGVVGATIKQVPNQPCVFKSDPKQKKRYEDAIIAFTWKHFILNGTHEPYWLLRLPMTKAVVRAMDTVTDFMQKVHPEQINVTKFIVAGESKRGWTTWTTGAVDKRVVGIAPTVLDILNMVKNLHHHYRSLGGWTWVFNDYYSENITQYVDDPNLLKMAAIVDPYSYRDRLTMPKMIVTAGSDEFFLPDDSYYFYDDLPYPKYLHIIPNDEHELTAHDLELTRIYTSFILTIAEPNQWDPPMLTWKRYENSTHGVLELTSSIIPFEVEAFRTLTNRGTRRDFRLAVASSPGSNKGYPNIILYKKFPVSNPESGKYVVEFLTPHIGWQCFFIRAHYHTPSGTTISFTTQASITPADKFAVPDCHGAGCKGTLV